MADHKVSDRLLRRYFLRIGCPTSAHAASAAHPHHKNQQTAHTTLLSSQGISMSFCVIPTHSICLTSSGSQAWGWGDTAVSTRSTPQANACSDGGRALEHSVLPLSYPRARHEQSTPLIGVRYRCSTVLSPIPCVALALLHIAGICDPV